YMSAADSSSAPFTVPRRTWAQWSISWNSTESIRSPVSLELRQTRRGCDGRTNPATGTLSLPIQSFKNTTSTLPLISKSAHAQRAACSASCRSSGEYPGSSSSSGLGSAVGFRPGELDQSLSSQANSALTSPGLGSSALQSNTAEATGSSSNWSRHETE